MCMCWTQIVNVISQAELNLYKKPNAKLINFCFIKLVTILFCVIVLDIMYWFVYFNGDW